MMFTQRKQSGLIIFKFGLQHKMTIKGRRRIMCLLGLLILVLFLLVEALVEALHLEEWLIK